MTEVRQIIQRAGVGLWNYRTLLVRRYGPQPIGREVSGFMDDFGNLIINGPWKATP